MEYKKTVVRKFTDNRLFCASFELLLSSRRRDKRVTQVMTSENVAQAGIFNTNRLPKQLVDRHICIKQEAL